ncbi:MAG: CDP-glycerol:poly(glycerophosphate)glycerophosph otransferase, partial [Massilia sp.]|nr:CDP-glycerol:poly(glycerophosphate)glycerophosph otransferase [Massilia sp.]
MISGQDSNFHAAKVPADAATDAPRRAPDDQAGGAALAGGAVRAAQPDSVLISVVVPAYNVAPYLEQCLTSILDQEGVNLELIVVDDGATDGSGRIADQCAERDARVRVIHQENSGPSASRNKGMAAARGAYLAFLDGDDYVLPGAYAALLESIQSNGADFVTANALRLTNGRQHQSGLHARAIEQDLRATNIRANPALLWDTVVWNKLFRIDFYREKIGDFADMLYEDMFPMCKAHLLANHVNVLSQHVCVWRSREDNSSITQDRGSPEHLVDRLDSYLQISDYLQAHAPHLLVPLQAKQLTNDFFLYFPSLALGNDRFKALFSGRIRTLVSSFRTESFAGLTPPARLVYELLMQGRIDDIEAMLPFCGRHARHYQTTCVAGRFIAELPFRTGPNRLASPIYDVTEQLPYEAAVTDVALTDAGCRVFLRVGVAHLDAAALAQCDIRLHMAEGNGRQALPMHLVRQADARAAGDDDAPCLQFFFDVDFIELAQAVSKPPRLREFVIDISVGHLHRRGPLSIGAKLPERWRTRQFGEWVIRPQLSETSLQIWMAATKILLTAVHKSSDQALDFVLYTKPGIKPAFLRFFLTLLQQRLQK